MRKGRGAWDPVVSEVGTERRSPLTLPAPPGMEAPRVPGRTVLFQRERSGLTYRVPALLPVPPAPILLAFAEQRLSPDDAHAHRLVQRTGTLAGGSVRVSGPRPAAGRWGGPARAVN